MNRSSRRRARAHLRTLGCTCHPTIHDLPNPPGLTGGCSVRHQAGCPLGDSMLSANQHGVLPVVIDTTPGCRR
jgi:hypothetical protein